MKTGDLLFVYGTLRRGASADLSRSSSSFDVTFVDTDRINGKLYNIGWYPGIKDVRGGAFNSILSTVTGDVFLIRDDTVRDVLDAYEGYPHLYDRCQVETEDGRMVWVYTYNGQPPGESFLPTGDWMDSPKMRISV
jgi:gamma-glutamylcyclotransferase (GGCT)/AIG2-like uncharacterized protein YtfP